MERILLSWIGGNDIDSAKAYPGSPGGPVLATLRAEAFDHAYLLYNYKRQKVAPYLEWLRGQTGTPIDADYCELSSPTDYHEVYLAADRLLDRVSAAHPAAKLCLLLSPGTPTMQAIWVLLGKTSYRCEFLQSSTERGVQRANIPFNIAAEFTPAPNSRQARQLGSAAAGQVPIDAAFDDIITRNPAMRELKVRASLLAKSELPVLINGETGTGKELFATAIHNASRRADSPLVTINCGAIPPELIDAKLFGHVKGAFTGAVKAEPGVFKSADGGSLFLDEFGELPLDAQVRLLRILEDGQLTPVGSSASRAVDVRIIAATNRDLLVEVAAGRFREDLFYRIAIGSLHLPPLRDRHGDLVPLVEHLMARIAGSDLLPPGYGFKNLSTDAINLILTHPWPGNVRELNATLLRAILASSVDAIDGPSLFDALFPLPATAADFMQRPIGNGFDIQSLIDEVACRYIERALAQTGNNKTRAAGLLGLKNHQTLSNWMKKCG